jgi:hypothetical protein
MQRRASLAKAFAAAQRALVRLGKQEQAHIIGQQLELAAAVADVPVTASCACRLGAAAG